MYVYELSESSIIVFKHHLSYRSCSGLLENNLPRNENYLNHGAHFRCVNDKFSCLSEIGTSDTVLI